jgi:chemotaxis protein methyltransferase CheR
VSAIEDPAFAALAGRIAAHTGLDVGVYKDRCLRRRIAVRMRACGVQNYADYLTVLQRAPGELDLLADALTINVTNFFRNPETWEWLGTHLLPSLLTDRQGRLRVWSAGCASGEEPYSLAMSLLAAFGDDVRWQLSVLATDLSTAVLATARRALYPIEQHIELPEHHLRRFALRGVREQRSWMKIGPAARSLVQFQPLNLVAAQWPVEGPFDAIFCRNVLIYFDADRRRRVVERLLGCLPVGGLLFLGHAETLHGMNACVRMVAPTVYERTREGLPG